LIDPPHDPVRDDDHDKAHQGLIKAGGGGHTDVAQLDQRAIDKGVDHIGGAVEHGGIARDKKEQPKVGVKDATNREQDQDNDERQQHGQHNVADLMPLGGAVNFGSFKKLSINTQNAGQVDNAAETDAIPQMNRG
jgi:hypothetical protein